MKGSIRVKSMITHVPHVVGFVGIIRRAIWLLIRTIIIMGVMMMMMLVVVVVVVVAMVRMFMMKVIMMIVSMRTKDEQ